MKCSSIALLATGALALQPSRVKRATTDQVVADVGTISASAAALDTAVKGFSSPSDRQGLIDSSGAVVNAINKATSDSATLPANAFDENTSGTLIPAISNLGNIVKTTVADLIAKKASFASFSLCPDVLSQVEAQLSAANKFQSTLVSKLTTELAPEAPLLASPIFTALSSASSAFVSCPAGSSATTSSTGSGSTPSTSSPGGVTTSGSSSSGSTGSTGSGSTVTSTSVGTSTETSSSGSSGSGVTSSPISTSTASSGSGGSSPSVTPSGNSTTPATSTSTIVPNANAGVRQVVGFGGLLAAAVAVVAFL